MLFIIFILIIYQESDKTPNITVVKKQDDDVITIADNDKDQMDVKRRKIYYPTYHSL